MRTQSGGRANFRANFHGAAAKLNALQAFNAPTCHGNSRNANFPVFLHTTPNALHLPALPQQYAPLPCNRQCLRTSQLPLLCASTRSRTVHLAVPPNALILPALRQDMFSPSFDLLPPPGAASASRPRRHAARVSLNTRIQTDSSPSRRRNPRFAPLRHRRIALQRPTRG